MDDLLFQFLWNLSSCDYFSAVDSIVIIAGALVFLDSCVKCFYISEFAEAVSVDVELNYRVFDGGDGVDCDCVLCGV